MFSILDSKGASGGEKMYKVLIADDEYEIRTGLYDCYPWQDIGFEAIGAVENGQAVLDVLETTHVDVVLSDIHMPGMDGLDLARIFYERELKCDLVLLSGYQLFDYARQAIVYGVKDYLVKPTKFEELTEVFLRLRKQLDSTTTLEIDSQENFPKNKIIRTIEEYISNNFSSVTLEGLSGVVNMNFQYISKYYKQKTGKSFSDYLLRIKMEKASELLLDYHNNICEVSELAGYRNPKNFSRAFRCFFGISPSEYRKKNGVC